MSELTLTEDQQAALEAFTSFIANPESEVFVLAGYAGTGKSTLVNYLLSELPKIIETTQMINQDETDWEVVLTATTNKAAEALAGITNGLVSTIHSHLKIIPQKDLQTGKSSLMIREDAGLRTHEILFIDEASYIDHELLQLIFECVDNCKIVFIGDPAQLTPVNSNKTPVFTAGFKTAQLSEVVRQAKGNPIIDLATTFRTTVNTGLWEQVTVDGQHIVHLPRDDFDRAVLAEMSRPDWHHNDSKVLAWTNKAVIAYNQGIRNILQGVPHLEVGDYAVCNEYINKGRQSIKTDQTVMVTDIEEATQHGVEGWLVELDRNSDFFLPASRDKKKALISEARAENNYTLLQYIERNWIDLRAQYACTINKSQGSTYDRVFIDLDDMAKCRNRNLLARMLYVAVSRAREQVFLTGNV